MIAPCLVPLIVLAACSGSDTTTSGTPASGTSPPRDVGTLVETHRWPIVAGRVGPAEGDRWLVDAWPDAIVMDRDREVERLPGAVVGPRDPLTALPGGRLAVGPRILDARRAVIYDAMARARHEGRFGHVRAWGIDRTGTTAVIAAQDAHGECFGGCRQKEPLRGELIRVELDATPPVERILDPATGIFMDATVAAGPSAVAVADRLRLRIWPARGAGAATEITLDHAATQLIWSDDGATLFSVSYVDVDHSRVIALDANHGFRAGKPWLIDGQLTAIALRPGHLEFAIGTVPVPFHGDGGRIRILGGDGAVHATLAVGDGIPQALAWTLDARSILAALGRIAPATGDVRRYDTR